MAIREINLKMISVDVVKYRDMPSRQWYSSPYHTDWYYHSPRTTPSEELSPKFLEATLDAPLKLLALGLNSLGYTTLPSCSGHYKDDDELSETYNRLVADARSIRKEGLELRDVENGSTLELQDSSWYLPWDRTGFLKAALGDGKPEGYLGFTVPKVDGYKVGKAVDLAIKKNRGCRYEVQRTPSGYVFELRVYAGKQNAQDRMWEALGDAIMLNLLK